MSTVQQQSLQDYLKAKREARARKRATRMVIAVTGYEDRFAARYKILEFDEKRDIQSRHDTIGEVGNDGSALVNASADFILNACEDLMEITSKEITGTDAAGKPIEKLTCQSLGKQWIAPDIADLFGVTIAPGVTTAREALKLVLDPDQIMAHFGAITREAAAIMAEVSAEGQGEGQPSGEGSPTSPPAAQS
jgi:hypothetical protein